MATKKKTMFRYHETFQLKEHDILETVLKFILRIAPLEKPNVFIERMNYGTFLAIKQYRADLVFMGEPDYVLKGTITVPHKRNTDVSVEFISEDNFTQIDSPTISIVKPKHRYELFVTKDDETFAVHVNSTDSSVVDLAVSKCPAMTQPSVLRSAKPKAPKGYVMNESGAKLPDKPIQTKNRLTKTLF